MLIKRWITVSLAAIALASCMATQPARAGSSQEQLAERCSIIGRLAVAAKDFKERTKMPVAVAEKAVHDIVPHDLVPDALYAVRFAYKADPDTSPRQLGQAVFDRCMENARLSTT